MAVIDLRGLLDDVAAAIVAAVADRDLVGLDFRRYALSVILASKWRALVNTFMAAKA